jgi:hypothetical protein
VLPVTAPTPDFILSTGADLAIVCDRCRELRVPHDLALALSSGGRGNTPVDQLVFRCERCGSRGVPWVTAVGNATIGRKRLWPPEASDPTT